MKALIVAANIALQSLLFSIPAYAIGTLTMVPAGDGKTWSISTKSLEGIAGIDFSISYDPSVLTSPTMTRGSSLGDALFMPNTGANPIRVNILAIPPKTLATNGQVATITFQRKTSGPANIILSATAVGADGSKPPIIASNPVADVVVSTDDSSNGAGTGTPTGGGGTGTGTPHVSDTGTTNPNVVGGTVTLPSDMTNLPEEKKTQQPAPEYKEEQPRETRPAAREAVTPEAKAPEAEVKAPEAKVVPPVKVLDRFKAYKGEMTSQALLALFTPDEKSTVKQEPAVLLADGKANLKVTIQNPQGKQAPNFALKKAKLVNLKMNADSAWVVVARPVKDAYEASITMLVDDAAVEIPLVVAPKVDMDLDKSGKVDEKDFQLFLKERGSDKAPKHDLNKDGRRDYIDDFIFTANYLAMQATAKEKPVSAKIPEKSTGGKQQVAPADKSQKQ